jgi:hypothetical protein
LEKSEVSNIGDLQSLVLEYVKARANLDGIRKAEKEASEDVKKIEASLLAVFEEQDLEKFSVKGLGTVSTRNNFSVSVPKGDSKEIFFNWLKEKGDFENLITVNSMTLNAYYKDEMAKAVEEGNVDFHIPGLEEPKLYKTLQLRKV